MSALDAEQKHAADLEGQAAALHQPTRDEYKPPLWKKIAAPFVGALAGRNAEPVVSGMLDGPYNRARQDFDVHSSVLQRQLEAERGINIPLAQDRARVSQEGFRNWMDIQKEQREKTAFQNETGDKIFIEPGADGQPHYFQTTKGGEKREVPEPREKTEDWRKREEDANTPAPGARPEPDPANKGQQRIKTKTGGYVPWNPRTVEEGALAGDPRATGLYNREHPGRENPEDTGGMSAASTREFTARTRPIQRQIDDLDKKQAIILHNVYQQQGFGSTSPALADGLKKNQDEAAEIDKQKQALRDKIDAVETEIMSRHAKAQQFKVDRRWPPPESEISVVRDPATKKVFAQAVKGKDGKLGWGPPQP